MRLFRELKATPRCLVNHRPWHKQDTQRLLQGTRTSPQEQTPLLCLTLGLSQQRLRGNYLKVISQAQIHFFILSVSYLLVGYSSLFICRDAVSSSAFWLALTIAFIFFISCKSEKEMCGKLLERHFIPGNSFCAFGNKTPGLFSAFLAAHSQERL